jgi:hypothetical protein
MRVFFALDLLQIILLHIPRDADYKMSENWLIYVNQLTWIEKCSADQFY